MAEARGETRGMQPVDLMESRKVDPHAGRMVAPLVSAVDSIERDIALVLREHEGMANELLRVYEHLGIVFDLTPRLLTLRSEKEVLDLLVQSLRSLFTEVRFGIVHDEEMEPPRSTQGAEGRDCNPRACDVVEDFDAIPSWIGQQIGESRRLRKVRVVNERIAPVGDRAPLLDQSLLDADQALIAPLFAGDSFVCALVLWRTSGTRGWESGEMLLMDSLATFCGDVIRNFRLLQELQQMSMDMVRTLVSAVDQKDPYTSGHSNRVGYYAKLLGGEIGFDEGQLRTLEWSALLHDVGKIGIRDAVLKKPGKLTDEEFAHIKEHPLRGYEVVRENPHMRDAVDGVLYHHERFNGKGYPKGLKGQEIPIQARIIQIADIFDALTTNRSYRGAYPWRRALEILEEESGTVVDPDLCATFVGLLRRLQERNPEAFDLIGNPVSTLNLTDAPSLASPSTCDVGTESQRRSGHRPDTVLPVGSST